MGEVFVSYARGDKARVSPITAKLADRGYEVWWDKRLHGGQDFEAAIEAALARCGCAVVAWSRIARHSLWVKAEADEARRAGKLVQITLDRSRPPLPYTMLHTLDFSATDAANGPVFDELFASIDDAIKGAPAAQPVPAAPLAGFGPIAAVGGAAIALVLLAAAMVVFASMRDVPSNAFALATIAMFFIAVLVFAGMVVKIILTYLASRR